MKLIGKYTRCGKNENNQTEITFTIQENYKHLIPELSKEELSSITITKARDKRTEQQNKYMWALIGEIDKARNGERSNDEMEIYIEALVRAGAKCSHLLVEPQVESLLRTNFRAIKFIRAINKNGKIFHDYKVFYGSSKFNKEEMSNLIETILDMADESDIDINYWRDIFEM